MEIIRGDTIYKKFQRHYCGGEVITELPDKMFCTIKYDPDMEEFLIQKTLNHGITFNPADDYYYLKFAPEDTDNLPFTNGVPLYMDIEVITGKYKRTIIKEPVEITSEVTHARNEG